MCPAGQMFADGQCKYCDDGEVSVAGSGSCNLCPQGTKKGYTAIFLRINENFGNSGIDLEI